MERSPSPIAVTFTLALAGCAARLPPPTAEVSANALWGAVEPDRIRSPIGQLDRDAEGQLTYPVLALCGLGSRGAFGAGMLCGWSDAGTRPRFQVVTGVSTGALMATFAFLGPEHDDALRSLFTNVSTRDVYRRLGLFASLNSGGVNDPEPLRRQLRELIDDRVLDAIAEEHRSGRRLYIGTTNLDTNGLLVWDMGAIAASERPDRLDRYHEVLIAAVTFPITMPPAYIEVEAGRDDGEDRGRYAYMVVDGAVKEPVLLRAFVVDIGDRLDRQSISAESVNVNLYIIVSGQLDFKPGPDFKVAPNSRAISTAALGSLYTSARDNALYRGYVLARRRRFGFHLTSIPPSQLETISPDVWIPERVQALFELGYEHATDPDAWMNEPPGLDPRERFPDLRSAVSE
jgi:hypothetical protein